MVGTFKGITDVQCTAECAEHPLCKSYNIHRENKICQLNSKKQGDFNVTLIQSAGWLYKSTDYNETLVSIYELVSKHTLHYFMLISSCL